MNKVILLVILIFAGIILFFIFKNRPADVKVASNKSVNISIRIDDLTFETGDKAILENALKVAKKYDVKFDLAVIAKPFDEKMNPNSFAVYYKNQNYFEVVAHGWNHKNPFNPSWKGEFFDITNNKSVPVDIQEQHIKNMLEVFKKNNLVLAQKILVLPWYAGDNQTINLAKVYGYKVIVQSEIPDLSVEENFNDSIIATRSYISIKMSESLTRQEVEDYIRYTNNAIERNQTKIQIVTHPVNYKNIASIENFISELKKQNPNAKFNFISENYLIQ